MAYAGCWGRGPKVASYLLHVQMGTITGTAQGLSLRAQGGKMLSTPAKTARQWTAQLCKAALQDTSPQNTTAWWPGNSHRIQGGPTLTSTNMHQLTRVANIRPALGEAAIQVHCRAVHAFLQRGNAHHHPLSHGCSPGTPSHVTHPATHQHKTPPCPSRTAIRVQLVCCTGGSSAWEVKPQSIPPRPYHRAPRTRRTPPAMSASATVAAAAAAAAAAADCDIST
jgi:hypothetical protein